MSEATAITATVLDGTDILWMQSMRHTNRVAQLHVVAQMVCPELQIQIALEGGKAEAFKGRRTKDVVQSATFKGKDILTEIGVLS